MYPWAPFPVQKKRNNKGGGVEEKGGCEEILEGT